MYIYRWCRCQCVKKYKAGPAAAGSATCFLSYSYILYFLNIIFYEAVHINIIQKYTYYNKVILEIGCAYKFQGK